MSFRTITGLILLAAGSLAFGWYAGKWGFSLFVGTVPAGSITELVRATTKTAYFTSGMILAALIFGWSVLVAWASRFFRANTTTVTASQPTAASAAR
ncbi:MAG TPA: hypothetical protein VJ826_12960 [Candidatus Polarisedimenticolaceae bacterium]|nr:hypothetical protein [Candidatus Polarisedimenticolaceae bacterium]